MIKNDKLLEKLSLSLGVNCQVDWVGRIYMVINPYIQNIKSSGNELILDDNNKILVEAWVMKNLNIIRKFLHNNDLFDILAYNITKIDDDENYLVVFKNVMYDTIRRYTIWGSILAIVAIIAAIILI